MIICKTCIEAIRSRGELVVIDDVFENDDATDWGLKCEWCDEPDSKLHSVHFPSTERILDLMM